MEFLGLLFSFFLVAFFSGMEYLFPELTKIQLEQPKTFTDKIILYFKENPFWFISTTRVGKITAYVISILSLTPLVTLLLTFPEEIIGKAALVAVILIGVVVIILFIEVLTKFFVKRNTSQLLYNLIIAFGVFFIVFFPLLYCYKIFVSLLTRMMKLNITDVVPLLVSPYAVDSSLNKDTAKSDSDLELDKKIFRNAIDFKYVRVRDCMIPRTEISAIAMQAGLEKLREAFVESGHSRIVVFNNNIDDVVGYCHSASLFKKPERIDQILTSIISVPENTLANDLMIRFISEQKSMAVVIDEFGGTSGIVTMEDVIEKIFGEIEDEHDQDDLVEQKLGDNVYLFSARLEIDYLNEEYKLNLPTGDYDTLGGLILSYTEDFPEIGKTVTATPFTFTVQSTTESRIDTVKVEILGSIQRD